MSYNSTKPAHLKLFSLRIFTTNPPREKSQKAIKSTATVLDAEKPNLVVLTGDIVTSKPSKEGWLTVIQPMVERKIPWAATLGNHDDEYDLTGKEIIEYISGLPYSLVQMSSEERSGSENFTLVIEDQNLKPAAVLYFIDSHGYPRA